MTEFLMLLRNVLSETIFVGENFLASDSGLFHDEQVETHLLDSIRRMFTDLSLYATRLEKFCRELKEDDVDDDRRVNTGQASS